MKLFRGDLGKIDYSLNYLELLLGFIQGQERGERGKRGSSPSQDRHYFDTVCTISSDPFYIVTYFIRWVTTSWTDVTIMTGEWGGIPKPILKLVSNDVYTHKAYP